MVRDRIYEEAKDLPDSIVNEALNYLLYLKERYRVSSSTIPTSSVRKAGLHKGEIVMSDDFDEPLDDFKEYM